MASIAAWQKTVNQWAVEKGWRGPAATPRTIGDEVALIHSEASEVLEAFRDNPDPKAIWYTYTVEIEGVKFPNMSRDQLRILLNCDEDELDDNIAELGLEGKPEGFGPEMADIAIRLLDNAEHHGLDLETLIAQKMNHNRTRPFQHGGKTI